MKSLAVLCLAVLCWQTRTIYYADLGAKTLNKMRLDGSGDTMIDRYYAYKAEGIAVDWIGRCPHPALCPSVRLCLSVSLSLSLSLSFDTDVELLNLIFLQCFNTVGWMTGNASDL